MRYESIPRKIIKILKNIFNFMKEEFGIWSYVIIGGLLYLLKDPVLNLLDTVSSIILFGALVFFGLVLLYWLVKRIF